MAAVGMLGVVAGMAATTSPAQAAVKPVAAGQPTKAPKARPSGGWVTRTAPGPSARNGAVSAYDSASGQLVYFGGSDSSTYRSVRNDTWLYAKGKWTQAHPATSPPARAGAAMAYDPITRAVVLFGGVGAGQRELNDTWAWDGENWQLENLSASPPARAAAAMAWDPVTAAIVLFGGATGTGHQDLGDTWNWNGSKWAQQMPSGVPPPRAGASFAFDPRHGQMLLFGGSNGVGLDLNDTWLWDGTSWWAPILTTSPSARDGAALTVSGALGHLVLFGGYQAGNHRDLADTWVWTGSEWQQQSIQGRPPSSRFGASAVYDDATQQLVLLGGTTGPDVYLDGGKPTSHQAAAGWWTWRSNQSGPQRREPTVSTPDGGGYWLAAVGGRMYGFGDAWVSGGPAPAHLNKPIVGMLPTPDGHGYWLFAADGGVFTYGDAGFFGSAGSDALSSPVVAMAITPDGRGYWLVTRSGRVLRYGDAPSIKPPAVSSATGDGAASASAAVAGPAPVVAIASTPDGRGYWLATATGRTFAAGDAIGFGSVPAASLKSPVVAMAPTADGGGYWLVTATGTVFNFGDAGWFGATTSLGLYRPINGIVPTPDGQGYWLTAGDGGVFTFGSGIFYGSLGGRPTSPTIA